jgi:hypothetical protein
MQSKAMYLAAALVLLAGLAHGDFKYTQQTKVTGGTVVSMAHSMGAFNKDMKSLTDPQITTHLLKSDRMREERSTGEVEIIDLPGRRFIRMDPAQKTYSIMTFEEFRAALERAQQRMKEEQAKQAEKHPDVKMVPKFDVKETGATRSILGLNTSEMKMVMLMEVQSDDPKVKEQMQNASFQTTADSWIAPSVPGYDEVHEFYLKMAKELNWLPGAMSGMGMASPQMGPAMDEFRKNAIKLKGMPLLQYVSVGMSGMAVPPPQAVGSNQPPPQQTQTQQSASDTSIPTSTSDAISKGLGGMLGGFGHKKKADQPQTASSGQASPPPQTGSGSMMDMTVEVTAFSSGQLDASLFEVPAGYTQVQRDPDDMFGGRRR